MHGGVGEVQADLRATFVLRHLPLLGPVFALPYLHRPEAVIGPCPPLRLAMIHLFVSVDTERTVV